MIITNPLRRCFICQGREILNVDENDTVTESSLIEIGGMLRCKDEVVCRQNVEAELTNVDIKFEGNTMKGYTIKTPDGSEVDVDES